MGGRGGRSVLPCKKITSPLMGKVRMGLSIA